MRENKSSLKILVLSVMASVIAIALATPAGAEEGWEYGIGLNLASSHIRNDLTHRSGLNEINLGGTVYFTDKGNEVPFADEFTLSFIGRNSFNNPSIYLMAHKDFLNTKWVDIALSAGVATGYKKHYRIADKLGVMPIIGLRVTIVKHIEIGLIPSSLFSKGGKGANTIILNYRF